VQCDEWGLSSGVTHCRRHQAVSISIELNLDRLPAAEMISQMAQRTFPIEQNSGFGLEMERGAVREHDPETLN
jgi:hypothetical protein